MIWSNWREEELCTGSHNQAELRTVETVKTSVRSFVFDDFWGMKVSPLDPWHFNFFSTRRRHWCHSIWHILHNNIVHFLLCLHYSFNCVHFVCVASFRAAFTPECIFSLFIIFLLFVSYLPHQLCRHNMSEQDRGEGILVLKQPA